MSPKFSFGEKENNQQSNNIDSKKDIFVSFRPEEKPVESKGSFTGLRNPNKKNINNINTINQNNQTNNLYNTNLYVRNNTPKFSNNNIYSNNSQISNTYLFSNANTNVNNRNTVGIFNKTPNKYINKLGNIYTTYNYPRTMVNIGNRNYAHSFDSGPRYYYPKIGLNNYVPNRNNNIYDQYYSKKYY